MTRIYSIPFAEDGDKEPLASAEQPDGKVSLATGWTFDYERESTDDDYRPVGRLEMNGILYEITDALAEIQQYGFATWQSITGGWPEGARVSKDGIIYLSTEDANVTEPGQPGATWQRYGTALTRDVGTGPEEISLNQDLGSAAFRNVGSNLNDLPTNAEIRQIGVGQTWQDVTASRSLDVVYTNSTPRPIEISVSLTRGGTMGVVSIHIYVQGIHRFVASSYGFAAQTWGSIIVPPGNTYRVSQINGGLLLSWSELR